MSVSMPVTDSLRGRAAIGGFGAGRLARGIGAAGSPALRAMRHQWAPRSDMSSQCSEQPTPLINVSRRMSQREATVAAPSRLRARERMTSAPQAPCRKSCAANPTARSGGGSPIAVRIGLLSHGPGSGKAGQVPSSSPARITRSAEISRASRGPLMAIRGWDSRGLGRICSLPIRLRSNAG